MKPIGELVDLFCGVGGVSCGFRQAGFRVMAGYDNNPDCCYAYENNNDTRFVEEDITRVTGAQIRGHFSGNLPTVLSGCAPCQPFSGYTKKRKDSRWELLPKLAELIIAVEADYFTMEDDPLHRTSKLSDRNLERICASIPGKTWHDWPEALRAECHKKAGEGIHFRVR